MYPHAWRSQQLLVLIVGPFFFFFFKFKISPRRDSNSRTETLILIVVVVLKYKQPVSRLPHALHAGQGEQEEVRFFPSVLHLALFTSQAGKYDGGSNNIIRGTRTRTYTTAE